MADQLPDDDDWLTWLSLTERTKGKPRQLLLKELKAVGKSIERHSLDIEQNLEEMRAILESAERDESFDPDLRARLRSQWQATNAELARQRDRLERFARRVRGLADEPADPM